MFLITFTLWIYLRYLFCVFPIVFYIFNHSTSSKTYILYPPWLDFWETHSSFLRNLFVCNFILCIIVWLTFLPKVVLLCPHVFISYLIVLSVSQHEKTVIYLKRSEKRLRDLTYISQSFFPGCYRYMTFADCRLQTAWGSKTVNWMKPKIS